MRSIPPCQTTVFWCGFGARGRELGGTQSLAAIKNGTSYCMFTQKTRFHAVLILRNTIDHKYYVCGAKTKRGETWTT